jgi:hypothetical protein
MPLTRFKTLSIPFPRHLMPGCHHAVPLGLILANSEIDANAYPEKLMAAGSRNARRAAAKNISMIGVR